MKFKKIFLFPILFTSLSVLGGCNVVSEEKSVESENSVAEIIPGQKDENFIDYVHDGSVKLALDYKGKDFYKDGIGEVTLWAKIDGDTAHFTPLVDADKKGTIKARFFGIDTPESTGKVQEWGKPASKFTSKMLDEANANGTIVVSSAQNVYKAPNPDSTGSRYVSLVWINPTKKNASIDELYLLNLWIVQEGYSNVKNAADMEEYEPTFFAAEKQAKTYKLNLFSGLPDETFNYGSYEDVSLLDVKREIEKSVADPNYVNAFDNKKIRFTGTVAGYVDHTLYIVDYYLNDEDHPELGGEWAGVNVYVGMSDPISAYTTPNTYLRICGLASHSDNFGFQIQDVQGRFPNDKVAKTENDCAILLSPEQNTDEHQLNTINYSISEINTIVNDLKNNSAASPKVIKDLYCTVAIEEELTVNYFYVSDSGDITLGFEEVDIDVYISFSYKGDPDHKNYIMKKEYDFYQSVYNSNTKTYDLVYDEHGNKIGHKFKVQGVFSVHKTMSGKIKYQLVPTQTSDIVWIDVPTE